MDEETPLADPLSYSEDVPYEDQTEPAVTNSKSDGLKGRIGNRIYLLEHALPKVVLFRESFGSIIMVLIYFSMQRKWLDDALQEDEELDKTLLEEDMAGRICALPSYGPWE